MILFAVETRRANKKILFDHCHVHLFDAVDEANEITYHPEDACCEKNVRFVEDDFMGPCPGGCEIRSPRIIKLNAVKIDSKDSE